MNFDASTLKNIAVFTSGGDAPGMNAALRSVVRVAIHHQLHVMVIENGFVGMIEGKIRPVAVRDMANIVQRGGTIIKTGRSPEFHKPEFRKQAAAHLKNHNIHGLVCIGGDGSFHGCRALWQEHQIPVAGIPGTIDNDLWGTERTVGFDTACNTALDAIDRIRDTAASHDRLFIVEVMGRNSGFIAAHVGLAGGAEEIFTPDGTTTVDKAVEKLKESALRGKTSSIIITAEGQKPGRAYDLAEAIRKKTGWDAKVSILGHLQRGGKPSAADRVLASRMGERAVLTLKQGRCDVMIASQGDQLLEVSLEQVLQQTKKTPMDFLSLATILAR